MKSVWSKGDLCLYRPGSSASFVIGVVKEVDVLGGVCTIAPDSSHDCLMLAPDDILPLNQDTNRLIRPDDANWVEQIDSTYFACKCDKLISIFSDEPTQALPRGAWEVSRKSFVKSPWKCGGMCICTWSEDDNYYYAVVTEVDPDESDRFLVTFCYYDNTEWKTTADLQELGSDFELLVEDELNKAVADRLRKHTAEQQPEAHNYVEIDKTTVVAASPDRKDSSKVARKAVQEGRSSSTQRGSSKNKQGSRRTSKVSENPTVIGTEKDSVIDGQSTTFGPSSSPLIPPGLSMLSSLKPPFCDDLQPESQAPWQALLISWFMCGYHTGYFEALHSGRNGK